MPTIIPIVEGHGEVTAVPQLIRRIVAEYRSDAELVMARPIRSAKSALLHPDGVERAVELAARQSQAGDGILILLDADDDCPMTMASQLLARARSQRSDRNIRVVLANREFEAWFLAGAASLRGKRGLAADLEAPRDPEAIRDAKGWLTRNSPPGRSYKPTIDQPALVQMVDLQQALRARSFQKFVKDVLELVA